MGSGGKDLTFDTDTDKCIIYISEGTLAMVKVVADQYRFAGNSFYYIGAYSPSASVTFENGTYKVKYNYSEATNVSFASDNSYLAFTGADGVNYRIYYKNPSSYSYKGTVIEEYRANFLGTHADGKLVVELYQSSSYSNFTFTVKYDGTAASNVKFSSETLMSFEIGETVHVAEIVDGVVTVTENVMNLGSEENKANKAVIGNYSSAKVVIDYKVEKTAEGYEGKFYATYNGADATFSVDSDKGVISVTSGETTKYFARYDSTTLVEVPADKYALLGTTTVSGHTVSVSAKAVKSGRNNYSISYTYTVDGNSATSTDKTTTDGNNTKFVQLKVGDAYYFYYVNGETKVLQALTADEIAIASLSSKSITVDGTTLYLKSSVAFADNTFTLGYTFGTSSEPVAITTTPVSEGTGFSFTYNDATYYYLTSGSYAYLVTAADYAIYGVVTAKDGTELKFTWGTKQVMVALKGEDGTFGTPVEAVKGSDGTHDYYKFVISGTTYILAKNTSDEWVLTDASSIGSNLKHFKNFGYQTSKVVTLENTTVFKKFEAGYVINDDGTPTYAFKLTDASDNVTVVTNYEEMPGGEVFKMTIGDSVRYFAVAANYAPSSSWYYENYNMVEVTEAQANLIGKSVTTADGVVYTVLLKGSYSAPSTLVYVGTESNNWSNNATATFSADGTSVTFTYGGVNYTATVVDGTLTVTEA